MKIKILKEGVSVKIKILKEGVTFGPSVLDVGMETVVDETSGLRLIKDGWAELVKTVEPPAGDDIPSYDEMVKAIDDLYKADDLKAKAKELGVEFDAKATKGEVIANVIEAGKYDALV